MISQTSSRQGRTKRAQAELPLFLDDLASHDEPPEPTESPQGQRIGNGATLGFEEKLWAAADMLRGHIDAAEYKHIVLGLVFLKYLADVFEGRARCLRKAGRDPESREAYASENIAWLPPSARWPHIEESVDQPELGVTIDRAMEEIERHNESLRNALPRIYSRSALGPRQLSELAKLIGALGLGDTQTRAQDVLGRIYEFFLGKFAGLEGKGGEFYTPRSVVKLLVEMVEPFQGKVYDPCCGSGGMFVQSERFVKAHGGKGDDILVYGQESNPTTWRLCKMNLAMRSIRGDIGPRHADTFRDDLHKELRADYIIANPPFNVSDWGGPELSRDPRWRYGVPPAGNANFAWVQHIIHHLTPTGRAGFVLSNGSLSRSQDRAEGAIRKALVDADLVDCIVALPGNLFYTTQIAACLWFIAKDKNDPQFRDRRGETLFIYAYSRGRMVDRVHRELTDDEVERIAKTYHSWRSKDQAADYRDTPGFCKSATLAEIQEHRYSLVPGRYVGFDTAAIDHWDATRLRTELAEVEDRLGQVNAASRSVLAVLQELLHG
jgi:type I restriction enzyme M protein